MTISAPVALCPAPQIDAFDCGVPPLNEWLQRKARGNVASGASHTYVACDGAVVVGYYALAAGAVDAATARRGAPGIQAWAVFGRAAGSGAAAKLFDRLPAA